MNTRYFLGLVFILIITSSSQSSQVVNNSIFTNKLNDRPKRANLENFKQINIFGIDNIRNNLSKLKFVSVRLISIKDNKYHIGDSSCYYFNKQNQLIKHTTYSNENKLKYLTVYKYNTQNQLIEMSSKGFDGEKPFVVQYFYNDLGQISATKEKSLFGNEHNTFSYDSLNYLIKKVAKSFNSVTNYLYDFNGNLITVLVMSKTRDTISTEKYKYNELSQIIESEHSGEPFNCSGRNKWKMTYNQVGDDIEATTHDLKIRYEYEYDSINNWTKKYHFYNADKTPNFLTRRKIEYYE